MPACSSGRTTIRRVKRNNSLKFILIMENLSSEWYNRRPVKILTHVAVWAVVLTLPYLLNGDHNEGHPPEHAGLRPQLMYVNFLTNFLWIGAFYLNAYWLTPKLFSHKKYVLYIGSLVLLFGVILAGHAFLFVDVFSRSEETRLNSSHLRRSRMPSSA